MKKNEFALVILLFFGFKQVNNEENNIQKNLMGKWIYQYSLIEGKHVKIETDIHCPTYKMVFGFCDDNSITENMPVNIQEMRKINYLSDICCYTYNQKDEMIDSYAPVAQNLKDSLPPLAEIRNYGLKYMSEYFIDYLNNDTLIIYDDKNHLLNEKKYAFVRHVYLKSK